MSQPARRITRICQFQSCQRHGEVRTISYYAEPRKLLTLRPRICDEHYRSLSRVDGPVSVWLNNLRRVSN